MCCGRACGYSRRSACMISHSFALAGLHAVYTQNRCRSRGEVVSEIIAVRASLVAARTAPAVRADAVSKFGEAAMSRGDTRLQPVRR